MEYSKDQKILMNNLSRAMVCFELVLIVTMLMRKICVLDIVFLGINAFTYCLFKFTNLNKRIISVVCMICGVLSFVSLAGLFVLIISVMIVYHAYRLYKGLKI